MQEIAIKVNDEDKADLLLEMLSAMSFVEDIRVHNSNISSNISAAFYVDPQQSIMEGEVKAFEQMHAWLVKHFLDKYVAVYQGKVVDADVDQLALIERVEQGFPDQVVLIRQVQKQLPPPLLIRSPRLEHS